MASKGENQPQSPPKALLNTKQVLDDALIFFAIVGGYLFLTITHSFNVFESLFDLTLDKHTEIIKHFLVYAVLTLSIKVIHSLYQISKKGVSENSLLVSLEKGANKSLFTVALCLTIYLMPAVFAVEEGKIVIDIFTTDQLCHISFWLLIAQVSNIYGSSLGELIKMDFFKYFGQSIETILLLGGLAAQFGYSFFELI